MTKNKCANCKKPTTNPEFCSRSCAASFNNRQTPKRKLQGKCKKCDSTIPSKKTYCEACAAIIKKEAYLQKNNICRLLGPNGECEKQLPRISSHGNFIFSKPLNINFTFTSRANEFIEHLLGLVYTKAEYVTPPDRRWLLGMLTHLTECKINFYRKGTKIPTSLSDIVVQDLPHYLANWVMSFFTTEYHPLLSTFALATSDFIGTHIFHTYHDNGWQIEPWISSDNHLIENTRIHFFDASFKKEFSEKMGGMLVVIKLPENAQLVTNLRSKEKMTIAPLFDIWVERCYLSQNYYQQNDCDLVDPTKITYDIFSNFNLPGYIGYSQSQGENKYHYLQAKIPAKWAIGVRTEGAESEILYLPKWLTD